MIPVKYNRAEARRPAFDDVELNLPEEWESGEHPEAPVYHKRRSAGLWTALASLAVALAVLAIYGYSVLSNQNKQLAGLPRLAKSISVVRDHTDTLASRLKGWNSTQQDLEARVRKLDAAWESRLAGARRYAGGLVSNAYQKEHAELNQRTAALKEQIAEMASRQQTEHQHLAQVEKDLVATRQELAAARESHNREMAALQLRQDSTQGEIDSIDKALSTRQVNFQAIQGRDADLAPGVSLHLTGTDVAHQQFRGWIWLAGARRRLWFRRQTVAAPVVFYPKADGQAYEMVVTRVGREGVAGYLVTPGGSESQHANVASNSKTLDGPVRGSF